MTSSAKTISQKKQSAARKPQPASLDSNTPTSDISRRHVFNLLPTVSKPELVDENGTSDLVFRQFLYDFSALGSYLESARAYLAAHLGVPSPQYNIVMIIAQYQGKTGVSVSDVAQHLHVSTAFITGEIRKLERGGLVEKRPNPNDGRSILLRLTRSGEERVQQIAPQRLFVNDHLFRGLSGEDFRHLTRITGSMIDDFAQTVEMLQAMRRDMTNRASRLASRE
jgi:DNA-binding MarR family transcriptional regulator